MAKEQNSITYTGSMENPDTKDTAILDVLMRKFQSAKRFSRERIFEGLDRKETVNRTKPLFLNNSRYMRDAFMEAEAGISSQKELLPLYVDQYNQAIRKKEKQIEKVNKSNKENKEEIIASKQKNVLKLTKKRDYFQHHLDNGTVPKVVDGSKENLRFLHQGKITKDEWKDLRTNSLYSRGEASKDGNENTKLSYLGDGLFELRVLNPLSEKKGDRLVFTVRFPQKFERILCQWLKSGLAYSIRIKRVNKKYEVHVTLDATNKEVIDFSKGCAGIDINPDNISVTIVHSNGSFVASKVFWMTDVNTVSANKRNWMVENTVIEAIKWIESYGIFVISIEDLKFDQKHSTNSGFNRMAHSFLYKKIINAIMMTCYKRKLALVQVQAYYSSLIGRLKYKKRFGLSDHQAAAYVLARRAMGYKEKIPKNILSVLFAKEAKKGQDLWDLFKHWSKVQKWHNDLREQAFEKRYSYKIWQQKDYLEFDLLQKALAS